MRHFYSLLFLLLAAVVSAQSLSPSVIASAGGSYASNQFSLDYTLGETFITTLTASNNILTQGFHQPRSVVEVEGCTSNSACNFNPLATIENGTCLFPGDACDDGNVATINDAFSADCICVGEAISEVPGCTDAVACNYDVNATVNDGSCYYIGQICSDGNAQTTNDVYNAECVCAGDLLGCMDALACNYNLSATIADGSCLYTGTACDDGDASTINDAYSADCVCVGSPVSDVYGCTAVEACNYNALATIEDNSCTFPGNPCDDGNALTFDDTLSVNCVCLGLTSGCTNSTACNYDAQADTDDGSCTFPGCNDPDACNFDSTAGCYDGYCDYPVPNYDCAGNCLNDVNGNGICDEVDVYGCTDVNADNYNPYATYDNGTCIYIGCIDPSACNFDSTAIDDDGSCLFYGCTDISACNYDSSAGCNDGSCVWPGCTDSAACNFNIAAGCDNGSCSFPGCNDAAACNYDASVGCLLIGSCNYPAYAYDCAGNCLHDGNNNGICDEFDMEGCTDITADNYNPNATVDDGSCIYIGCLDPAACNFDSTALTDDGSCIFPGCMDSNACNYDASAGCDDSSCVFPGCLNLAACNYNANAGCDDGSCTFPGCTDVTACNYDALAGCPLDGICLYPEFAYDCAGICLHDGNSNGICDEFDFLGCMDVNADNYNPNATTDDGSCIYLGCTDPAACNFDSTASDDDGSCEFPGCMNMDACNYDSTAGCDDGSCLFPGCANAAACNYDSNAGCDDGSCFFPGCTYVTACNYDDLAGCDDGSCVFPGCTDSSACNYDAQAGCLLEASCIYAEYAYDCAGMCLQDVNNNGICDPFDIMGCTDSIADNYIADATFDDGSCIYLGCMDATACNFDSTATTDDNTCTYPSASCFDCSGQCLIDVDADGVCDCLEIPGCTNPLSVNYNPLATNFDGSCMLGCIDPLAINYDAQANEDDGTCLYQVLGCTYPSACNFNPEATTDNNSCTFPGCNDLAACNFNPNAGCLLEGSCEYLDENNNGLCDLFEIYGCTNSGACNYNSQATFEDGSCGFNSDTTIYVTTDTSYEWNTVLLTESGEYTYTYITPQGCDSVVVLNLTITSIAELDLVYVQIWPNPSSTEVSVLINAQTADAIEVFDMVGKHIITVQRQSRIDVSSWASGIYMLRVHSPAAVIERRLEIVR